jgi:predicted dehydrogenase
MSPKKHSNPTSPIEITGTAVSRRRFIYTSAMAASSLALAGCLSPGGKYKSPNEKLNVGIIGCDGKGEVDSEGMSGENIVALCDVDTNALAKAAKKWPKARQYRDYRVMIETEKTVDAVTVTIPDHSHASAAMCAIKHGKHVYCQKPLTHTIYEARALTHAARKYKVATQMGNQGHCNENIRKVCEMIWSGVIGQVREVHCWTDRPYWYQGLTRPGGTDPVPDTLDWDLWVGPAAMRPFLDNWPAASFADTQQSQYANRHPNVYHPFSWRGWWDFGCGSLGDMGCHVMDAPNWALALGAPVSVELVDASRITREMAPYWSIIRYQFPDRGDKAACTLTWYDGGKQPPLPEEMAGKKWDDNGTFFVGDKGKIVCGALSEDPHLLPKSVMKGYQFPAPTIPRVPQNDAYQDFIRACKGGPPASSNFDVSGPLTETVLLGNLVMRLGKKLEWDSATMQVTNAPEAEPFIRAQYREGWGI